MYFPFLRGKQFELIALRELAEKMGEAETIHPVIEPVKKTISTLESTVDSLIHHNVPFTLIINPLVGDFRDDPSPIIDLVNRLIQDYEHHEIGIILNRNTDLGYISRLIDRITFCSKATFIHLDRFSDLQALHNLTDELDIVYNIFNETLPIRRYRKIIRANTKVILSDNFNSRRINAEYAENPDEFFSEEHKYFEEDGYVGFSDYSIIGYEYNESGFAPYAVAVHLTYHREVEDQVWIRHFVSDSNDDYLDVAGKYREALDKLIQYINNENIQSEACDEFRQHARNGHYPGLGTVKKLSIKHHIELLMNLLEE